jgi:hypothetical protein
MGKMGEDSSRLTLAQMKEYIASNNSLTDKTDDKLTTGNIYDYVIEGLIAASTASPVLSACSPSVSFSPPSLMVNLRQVAPVVNPASQALSSVQVVLILEWIVLSVSTLKLDQPFTSGFYFVNGIKCLLSNQKKTPICSLSKSSKICLIL